MGVISKLEATHSRKMEAAGRISFSSPFMMRIFAWPCFQLCDRKMWNGPVWGRAVSIAISLNLRFEAETMAWVSYGALAGSCSLFVINHSSTFSSVNVGLHNNLHFLIRCLGTFYVGFSPRTP